MCHFKYEHVTLNMQENEQDTQYPLFWTIYARKNINNCAICHSCGQPFTTYLGNIFNPYPKKCFCNQQYFLISWENYCVSV